MFRPDAEWFSRILETVPGFLLVIDRANKIRYINRLEPGYELNDVVGADADVFIQPDASEVFHHALAAVFGSGENQKSESEVILPDGHRAWYRSEMFPLREGGDIVAALVVATNITELKAATTEVAQLRRLLPICSWCGKIRTEEGDWQRVERYLKKMANTDVTHGICPSCTERETGGVASEDGTSGRGVP